MLIVDLDDGQEEEENGAAEEEDGDEDDEVIISCHVDLCISFCCRSRGCDGIVFVKQRGFDAVCVNDHVNIAARLSKHCYPHNEPMASMDYHCWVLRPVAVCSVRWCVSCFIQRCVCLVCTP